MADRALGPHRRALLERWLGDHGYARLDELRGLALPHLQEPASHASLAFAFDAEACTQCGRCVTVCAYGARHLTPQGEMLLERSLCRSCGLCATVCPTEALRIQGD